MTFYRDLQTFWTTYTDNINEMLVQCVSETLLGDVSGLDVMWWMLLDDSMWKYKSHLHWRSIPTKEHACTIPQFDQRTPAVLMVLNFDSRFLSNVLFDWRAGWWKSMKMNLIKTNYRFSNGQSNKSCLICSIAFKSVFQRIKLNFSITQQCTGTNLWICCNILPLNRFGSYWSTL